MRRLATPACAATLRAGPRADAIERCLRGLALLLVGLLTGRVDLTLAAETSLSARLRALENAVAQCATRSAERAERAQAASRVADEIAELKAHSTTPRADRGLEARLRAFDRLAARLDDADRRLQDAEQQRARARRDFLAALEAESLALTAVSDASVRAERARALDAAQRRAEASVARASPFRPLLDVSLDPHESGPDLDTKVALLHAEQARGREELQHMARARRLLEARLDGAQRLALEAEAARREAGPARPLLQREADALKLQVRTLRGSLETLTRSETDLQRALATIETRLIEAARRQAGPGSTTP